MKPVGGSPSDWQEISRALTAYCMGLDRLDFDLVRSCFHPDAHLDYGPYLNGSIDEFIADAESDRGVSGLDRTMHVLGNILIMELEGDVAWTESYSVTRHEAGPDHEWCKGFVVAYGRYVDRFERRDGEWRIADRTYIFEWWRNESGAEDLPLDPRVGARDRTDPRYRRT